MDAELLYPEQMSSCERGSLRHSQERQMPNTHGSAPLSSLHRLQIHGRQGGMTGSERGQNGTAQSVITKGYVKLQIFGPAQSRNKDNGSSVVQCRSASRWGIEIRKVKMNNSLQPPTSMLPWWGYSARSTSAPFHVVVSVSVVKM